MKNTAIYLLVFLAASLLVFIRCANVSRGPSGGPKDTIPPIVLKTTPPNGATNFSGKRVEVVLNEYPKLKDPQKQFIISPPMSPNPIYRTKGKGVIVEFQDSLRSNTTYHLDFGSSITDNTEGNALEDFSLTFSTDSTINIGRIKGRTLDAYSLEPIEDVMIFVYEKDIDSLPFTSLPDGLARTSKKGFFIADRLKQQPYKLVAVEDKNNNHKYEPGMEKVGFVDSMVNAVNASKDSTNLSYYEKDSIQTFPELPIIRLFMENTRKQYLDRYTQPEERKVVLAFVQRNPIIESLVFQGIDSSQLIVEKTFWGDTLTYWLKADSIPRELKANITYLRPDSLDNIVPFSTELKFPERKPKPVSQKDSRQNKEKEEEKPTLKVDVNTNQNLVTEKGVTIKVAAPLISLDTTKIGLYKFRDMRDTVKSKVPLQLTSDSTGICYFNVQTKWQTSEAYELVILPSAFTDIYKLENDSIVRRIETPNENKFSILTFDFSNVSKSYIVEILKEKRVVQQRAFSSNGKVTFSFLAPGEYRVRLIEDLNGNQRWDEGSYLGKRQPERVAFIQVTGGGDVFNLRTNWENEFSVDIESLLPTQ